MATTTLPRDIEKASAIEDSTGGGKGMGRIRRRTEPQQRARQNVQDVTLDQWQIGSHKPRDTGGVGHEAPVAALPAGVKEAVVRQRDGSQVSLARHDCIS